MEPTFYISNHIEALIDCLHQELLSGELFTPHWVLVPRKELKNFYLKKLAEKDAAVAVMGFRFEELGSGIQAICRSTEETAFCVPPLDILTLHLEALLWSQKEKFAHLLGLVDSQQATRHQMRQLAVLISQVFTSYGKADRAAFDSWLQQDGWQQQLWQAVFSHWNHPHQLACISPQIVEKKQVVHLLNFPFLAPCYHQLFARLARHIRVIYYQFSPCREFWTDTVSEKKRVLIDQREAKRGVGLKVRQELAGYLKDRNLLLANWGELYRRSFRCFEERNATFHEHYVALEGKTLLEQVQAAILQSAILKKSVCSEDQSIVCCPAFSRLREVEILYKQLLQLTNQGQVSPSEIRIFAPDITDYAPYIQLVFGAEDCPFRFSIYGLPRLTTSDGIQAIWQLLLLRDQRFDLASIESFLSQPIVQKKFQLKKREVSDFLAAMKTLGVKWGMDRQHRTALIGQEPLEDKETGTWEYGFFRFFEELTHIPKEPLPWGTPFSNFSQVESSGKCITLLRSLRRDLEVLEHGEMTLAEWKDFLLNLVTTYFDFSSEQETDDRFFEARLEQLSKLDDCVEGTRFSAMSIKEWLFNALEEKKASLVDGDLNALFFGSLKLGAVFPAKVTYLLGMEEESFPRLTFRSSLNEINPKEPSSVDEDRALFLELFLSTRQAFYCSYLALDPTDGKRCSPSSLIQEMLSYLDTFYSIEGEKPSKALTMAHPPFPFHHRCFSKEPTVRSFSKRYYAVAKSVYSPTAYQPCPLIPAFLSSDPLPPLSMPGNHRVTLKELASFAAHPLKFYCRKVLQIYLDYPTLNEEFALAPLNRFFLRQFPVEMPLDEVMRQAEIWGKLPLGRFKEGVETQLAKEWSERQVDQEKTMTIELTLAATQLEQVDDHAFIAPPLTVALAEKTTVHIEGVIHALTAQGLVVRGPKTTAQLIKVLPAFLVLCCLDQAPAAQALVWAQKNKACVAKNPGQALKELLTYYMRSQAVPSPCLPQWTDCFLQQQPEALSRLIAQQLKQGTDPYVQWIFGNRAHFSPEVMVERWRPLISWIDDATV
ncbi:MAG: exodeoxyribonuclease V subunit gamma [Chlamydiota bacterium]